MSASVLRVDDLRCYLGSDQHPVRAVDGVSFDIEPGQTFALLGESGCGKSMTALSLMRLLPVSGRIRQGRVEFQGRDLLRISETEMRGVRGRGISMIFQEPMTSLNPVLTVGRQIMESMRQPSGSKSARTKAVELLDLVGIAGPEKRLDEYPHQLSGGMKQRVVISIALANEPELLIADEPTTALDVTIQAQVLDLIRDLQRQRGMAVMLITHDLGVVNELADDVAVMYAGQIVEKGKHREFFDGPLHPYSQKLFESLPAMAKKDRQLNVIPGLVPALDAAFKGCRFATRCHRVQAVCRELEPGWADRGGRQVFCHLYARDESDLERPVDHPTGPDSSLTRPGTPIEREPLLGVTGLKVHFPIRSGVLKRVVGYVRAVDGIDAEIPRGHTLALVGESGCGKTTAGKGILQLLRPTAGTVVFEGTDLGRAARKDLRQKRSDIQIIFQDPYSSMNPRMLVADIVAEGLRARSVARDPGERSAVVGELLHKVGLPAEAAGRYPHEFSGGQRQRISIARALAVNPKLIVCDEPTSALDVSVQAQILNLLRQLQLDMGISYLFITHNISVVAYLAHYVAVMYLGRIVEYGPVETILTSPRHPYTQALLSAVPAIRKSDTRAVIRLRGDMPSPSNPPAGCFFHPRCDRAMDVCRSRYPGLSRVSGTHVTNCHLYTGDT